MTRNTFQESMLQLRKHILGNILLSSMLWWTHLSLWCSRCRCSIELHDQVRLGKLRNRNNTDYNDRLRRSKFIAKTWLITQAEDQKRNLFRVHFPWSFVSTASLKAISEQNLEGSLL